MLERIGKTENEGEGVWKMGMGIMGKTDFGRKEMDSGIEEMGIGSGVKERMGGFVVAHLQD